MPDKKPQPVRLTEHFTLDEFACKCGCKGEEAPPIRASLAKLAVALEALRTALGNKSMTINSGYRCPDHNAKVGGEKLSQHTLGTAADVVVDNVPPSAVQSIAHVMMHFGGVGSYDRWTHVDIRPRTNNKQARWQG